MLTYADVCLDLRMARDCYERARRLGSERAAVRLSELSKHLTSHATAPQGVLKAAGLWFLPPTSLRAHRQVASGLIGGGPSSSGYIASLTEHVSNTSLNRQ